MLSQASCPVRPFMIALSKMLESNVLFEVDYGELSLL
jgi:hypothetical protein